MAVATKTPYTPISSGFWRRVRKHADGCWEWTGQINDDGYGRFGKAPRPDGRSSYAHRFSYQAMVGDIPEGMQVDHRCHDPKVCPGGDSCTHRRCVNPDHLEVVEPVANVLRSNGLAAKNAAKTTCPRGHSLSGDNLMMSGRKRRCRTCRNRLGREGYAARRAAAGGAS